MTAPGSREIYELLTARVAPHTGEGETLPFDRIVRAPVDDETVGLVAQALLDVEPAVRCDALMAFAYFDPEDLHVAVREFLTDPNGRNRLQAVRILDVECSPKNLPTLLTLGVDPYHEDAGDLTDAREWLVVREAARAAVEHTVDVRFPAPLEEEEVEGVRCVYHAWDSVWQWAAREGIRGRG